MNEFINRSTAYQAEATRNIRPDHTHIDRAIDTQIRKMSIRKGELINKIADIQAEVEVLNQMIAHLSQS